jgi:hypothetical protein
MFILRGDLHQGDANGVPAAHALLSLFVAEFARIRESRCPNSAREPAAGGIVKGIIMSDQPTPLEPAAPDTFRFYRHALEMMHASKLPFLVGGAYALGYYTGITRHTKDLDLFVRAAQVRPVLDVFAQAGYRTEILFSHWLAKVFHDGDYIDVIFSSGNGFCNVDDGWFDHAIHGEVLGEKVRLVAPEEMIWQKAYIMERERFDGADVLHMIRARGPQFDWNRLLTRFGTDWRVLLSHLILFGFVYPNDQNSVPAWVLRGLTSRLDQERTAGSAGPLCRGTLLSRTQYLPDTEQWGYIDPRLTPLGPLTKEHLTRWTDAGR